MKKISPLFFLCSIFFSHQINTNFLQTAIQLSRQERYKEALECLKQCTQNEGALCNQGWILRRMHRCHEAIDCYEQSLQLQPNNPKALLGAALSYLTIGNFQKGWPAYEYRWANPPEYNDHLKNYIEQYGNLGDKSVLLKCEFGLGDTMQFIRYAQLLKELGAYVVVQAQKPLVKLLSLQPYIDEVIPAGSATPTTDFTCQLMSTPYILQSYEEAVLESVPYLHADKNLEQKYKQFFEDRSSNKVLKIGLCWQAEPRKDSKDKIVKKDSAKKSIPLELLAQLALLPNVQLFSLQKVDGLEQMANLPENITLYAFKDFDEASGPFMDTAALMKNLDLIITIDTSVAHLAGGLGVAVWVLLPHSADWRWMLDRDDSPWYPTMKLFRQKKPGDWLSVVQEIKRELKNYSPRCNAAA